MTLESLFFDLIIFLFLGAVGYALYRWGRQLSADICHKSYVMSHNKFWLWFRIIVLGLAWLVVFYGSFIEPQIIIVDRQTIHLGNSGTFVRLAVLGDLHLGPYKGTWFVNRVLAKVKLERPDLVLFTGDYVYDRGSYAKELAPFSKLYDRSRIYMGTYGILGNHDYGLNKPLAQVNEETLAQVKEGVRQGQIALFNNDYLNFWMGSKRFYIAGIEDIWSGRDQLSKAIHNIDKKLPLILLSHNADVALSAPNLADLIIAGHVHGGQIRLPFLGPIANIPTLLGRDYVKGLFDINNNKVFINSGLGEAGPRARLFTPPEISILNIEL